MADTTPIPRALQRLLGTLGVLALISFSPTALALDLLQIYRLALTNDASYLAARAAADAGREAVPQALAQLLPSFSLNASGFQNRLEQSAPNILGDSVTSKKNYDSSNLSWNLRQPIYRKQQFAQYEQAKAQVESVEATLDKDGQDLCMVAQPVGGKHWLLRYFTLMNIMVVLQLARTLSISEHLRW